MSFEETPVAGQDQEVETASQRVKGFLRRLNQTDGTLKQKVFRGGFWIVVSQLLGRGLQVLKIVVLVRILLPDDFGLMRLAALSLGAIVVFTETGIAPAIIHHRRGASPSYLNAAWTISVMRGIVLYALMFVAAPLAATFFAEPVLCPLTRVISLSFILRGFANPGQILLTKELDFKRLTVLQQSANGLSTCAAIIFGLILRNVWCLVIGQLAASLTLLAISYLIHPFRPRLSFQWKAMTELFSFGKHILATGVIIFLLVQGANAFLGKMLGVRILGVYSLMYFLACIPATAMTGLVSQLAFPTYSKLQDDIRRLRRAYLRAFSIVALVALPVAVLLLAFSGEVVLLAFGPKYLQGLGVFRILVVYATLMALGGTLSPLAYGTGRPKVQRNASFWQLIVLSTLIYPLTLWMGISGTALAATVAMLAGVALLGRGMFSFMKFGISELLTVAKPALVGVLVMAVAVFPFALASRGSYSLAWAMVGSIVGCFLYMLTVFRSGGRRGHEGKPWTAY